MTDLVGRLRHISGVMASARTKNIPMSVWEDDPAHVAEAATALEAKEKELAVLRGQITTAKKWQQWAEDERAKHEARAETAERVFDDILDELGCERNNEAVEAIAGLKRERYKLIADLADMKDRALKAERERDQAREALKPFAEAWVWSCEFNVSVQSHIKVEDFRRAARAITGED